MRLIRRVGSFLGISILLSVTGCKKEKVPVVSTIEITDITSSSAVSGGVISDEGSDHVTTKGVCWGLEDNPTIDNDTTISGTGPDSFVSNIKGLTEATTYYARAYATNKAGTGYGESRSFVTIDTLDKEAVAMQNYMNSNPDLRFHLKPSGLYYMDIVVGTGSIPSTHDTAYVKYVGKFLDETVFSSNLNAPDLIFPVNEGKMIAGFDEGVSYMKEGGKALFLMPSKLAYGSQGYYAIPPFSPLLFEVDLVKVTKGN